MEYDKASETQTMEKDNTVSIFIYQHFRGRSRTPALGGEWPSGLRCWNDIGGFQVKPHRRLVGLRDPTLLQGSW